MKFDYQIIIQEFTNIISKLLDIHNIINILTIITSTITIISVIHKLRQSKLKIYTQYILDNIFIDRKTALCEISNAIKEKHVLINIYGRKGVGKSKFLQFYCDLVNHKLKRKDRRILKKQFKKRSEYKSLHFCGCKAFYLEISGYQNRSNLNSQISEIVTGKSGFFNIEIAEKLKRAFVLHKKIIIIIDNVNTQGLEKELENIIKIFYRVSSKFCFVIGSIRELNLLGLLNISHKDIELLNFEEDDIRDFMLYNYPILNCDILADVLNLSDGLPILVNLFLKGFKEKGVLDNNMQVRKYIRQITESLTEKELKIAQIIALLSITKANISTNLLNCVISDFNENDITILESNALIEFHPIKREIKMHNIFRDFINSYYIMQEQKYILKLYRFFKLSSTEYECAYYAILVEDISIKDLIIPTIEKAISSENFSFLLLFGEHIKNIYGFQSRIGNISNKTFYTILLGYLEGLIGVGDYPAAKEIIDRCALTIRGNNISVHLRLSLLIANLYHLQNQYQEAIASYEILLNEINSKAYGENCLKYEAKCLWGIAHSYRHEGLNYTLAEAYYREAITSAQVTNQRSIILKCHFELVTIYILQNNQIAAYFELKLIDKIFKDLPSDQYVYTRIAYKKIRARYIRVFGIDTLEDDLELLQCALSEYELQKKRLQYNTFFDIGEYFRHHNQYIKAVENYSIALNFSKKNHDLNLETMSRLGLVLCNISQQLNTHIIIESLKDILKDCIKSNLYTNSIFVEIILDIVQNNKLNKETENKLKSIGINWGYGEFYFEYSDINNIHLILM